MLTLYDQANFSRLLRVSFGAESKERAIDVPDNLHQDSSKKVPVVKGLPDRPIKVKRPKMSRTMRLFSFLICRGVLWYYILLLDLYSFSIRPSSVHKQALIAMKHFQLQLIAIFQLDVDEGYNMQSRRTHNFVQSTISFGQSNLATLEKSYRVSSQ